MSELIDIYVEAFYDIFAKNNCEEDIYNAALSLAETVPEDYAPVGEALNAYVEFYENKKGILRVYATSVFPIPENARGKIVNKIESLTKKKVFLICDTDPALIGGLRLRAGEKLLDGSVASRFRDIKEFLNEKI
jgi:F-type H+-transporting ATPase subunit delta